MPASDKPRHRSGYSAADTALVVSACLSVAVTLGAYLEDVCIVGGLVPPLLIDLQYGSPDVDKAHPGTNDLDIGLALAVLDDERYAELAGRLRQEGFEPDRNAQGNVTIQRWSMGRFKVTIDFLIPPAPNQSPALRIQPLEGDFGAIVTPGLELAFEERVMIELDGHTLAGERARRAVPVCGAAAFTILKALAFGDRSEPKDAYDLVYVLRGSPGGPAAVAGRIVEHADVHGPILQRGLDLLARDFTGPDSIGPRRAAEFDVTGEETPDEAAADANGYVADLLAACRAAGLPVADAS